MKFHWTCFDDGEAEADGGSTWAMELDEGYLYRYSYVVGEGGERRETMVFVPNPPPVTDER